MRYSDISLKVLAAKEAGIIKSNSDFWKKFKQRDVFEEELSKYDYFEEVLNNITNQFLAGDNDQGIVSVFDYEFPAINKNITSGGQKPYLLFYKGNLDLLSDLNNNVAVIGTIDIDEKIEKRETEVVKRLVEKNLVIVSGLAVGCDTIAHKACIENGGKTIAILPTPLNRIYPSENKDLANDILETGGLLISEYYKEDKSKRFEAINRLVERDRLQAMFSKAIILIASYRKDEGDSGSRHAMEAAKKYDIDRFVMYNSTTDNDKKFGLNMDLLDKDNDKNKKIKAVKVLQGNSINEIFELKNNNLLKDIELEW